MEKIEKIRDFDDQIFEEFKKYFLKLHKSNFSKKFPGNPTMSYRSKHPVKVVGEVKDWQGHSAEQLKAMKDGLAKLKEQGIEAIED